MEETRAENQRGPETGGFTQTKATGSFHEPGGLVLARLGDRLIALALDTALLVSILAVIAVYLASRFGGITHSGFSIEGKPALISLLAVALVGLAYHWLLEGLAGATLGKAIMGLRVRGKSGKACGLKASLIRNLLRVVDGLGVYLVGLLVALFSRSRQRLGDHLGGTVVVEQDTSNLLRATVVFLWFLGVGSGLWFAYTIHHEAMVAGSGTPAVAVAPATQATGGSNQESAHLQASSLATASQGLSVVDLAFLVNEDGPERPEGPFKPGEKVHARFQVKGFGTDSQGKARLFFDVVALDPDGLRLYENWKPTFEGSLANPTDPVPATMQFDIPLFAPAGVYKLAIKVKDAVGQAETELLRDFTVGPAQAKAAHGLEIRDFAFSKKEDGPPLARAEVEGAERLYMAFKVAGIVFRDDRPDLSIDMQVLDPQGEVVLDQPGIVKLADPLVYHPTTFFAKVTSWVDFPAGITKGSYTARFKLFDGNSGKQLTHEAQFQVK
jgi:uncharacterized RDD family membrane protein YckC